MAAVPAAILAATRLLLFDTTNPEPCDYKDYDAHFILKMQATIEYFELIDQHYPESDELKTMIQQIQKFCARYLSNSGETEVDVPPQLIVRFLKYCDNEAITSYFTEYYYFTDSYDSDHRITSSFGELKLRTEVLQLMHQHLPNSTLNKMVTVFYDSLHEIQDEEIEKRLLDDFYYNFFNTLIQHGLSVNGCKMTRIASVPQYFDPALQLRLCLLFLDNGADVNEIALVDSEDTPAPHWCSSLLLSALSVACLMQNSSLVRFFLHNGANPNHVGPKGLTPLMLSALGKENVETLLGMTFSDGAGVTTCYSDGIPMLLLEYGANIAAVSDEGKNAYQYAINNPHFLLYKPTTVQPLVLAQPKKETQLATDFIKDSLLFFRGLKKQGKINNEQYCEIETSLFGLSAEFILSQDGFTFASQEFSCRFDKGTTGIVIELLSIQGYYNSSSTMN